MLHASGTSAGGVGKRRKCSSDKPHKHKTPLCHRWSFRAIALQINPAQDPLPFSVPGCTVPECRYVKKWKEKNRALHIRGRAGLPALTEPDQIGRVLPGCHEGGEGWVLPAAASVFASVPWVCFCVSPAQFHFLRRAGPPGFISSSRSACGNSFCLRGTETVRPTVLGRSAGSRFQGR